MKAATYEHERSTLQSWTLKKIGKVHEASCNENSGALKTLRLSYSSWIIIIPINFTKAGFSGFKAKKCE